MSKQATSHATPTERPGAGAAPRQRRRVAKGYLGMVIGILAIAAAVFASSFLPSQRPAAVEEVSQTYGVEVLHVDKSSSPVLITVRTAENETLACLRPTAQDVTDREPLRNCTPTPDVTTIPAK